MHMFCLSALYNCTMCKVSLSVQGHCWRKLGLWIHLKFLAWTLFPLIQSILKYSRIFQNIYSRLFQNIPDYSRIFRNILEKKNFERKFFKRYCTIEVTDCRKDRAVGVFIHKLRREGNIECSMFIKSSTAHLQVLQISVKFLLQKASGLQ